MIEIFLGVEMENLIRKCISDVLLIVEDGEFVVKIIDFRMLMDNFFFMLKDIKDVVLLCCFEWFFFILVVYLLLDLR